MTFDWAHYLDLAKELHTDAAASALEEAKLRAAISRAYYATFCLARNYLLTNHPHIYIPMTGDAHIIVKDTFENDPDPVWNAIGIHLDRLRQRRNKADYHNTIANLPADARMSLLTADQAILKIQSLP
jgi:uncharacterized protein (UPF0332 family)